jgi:hypothetical protein
MLDPGAPFGSLTDVLKVTAPVTDEGLRIEGGPTHNIMRSAGPVSDAYILSTDPIALISGPGGSGKTTASVKKAIVEAMRIRPGPDGVRRYTLGVWRQKYDNLWKTTLPSWWKILPRDLPGSNFTGSSPRAAEHVIPFRDKWGPIFLTARFRAFGEVADPDDIRGNEFTDVYLNEMDTLPEDLAIGLVDRIGRDPPRQMIGRDGRIFGDQNAPDVLNWTYRDFYEVKKPGYKLFRQPGGLDPGAENLDAMGRGYYENSARLNAHRKWWVNRMVHNRPGFTRDVDLVYPAYDDDRNLAPETIAPAKGIPITVGVDGGLTPAALYKQEMPSGQSRWLAEVALERGGMAELARAMLVLEATRFAGFEAGDFFTVCDPAMCDGEDTEEGSARQRLAKRLGRPVAPARTNDTGARWDAVRAKLALTVDNGAPGLLIDPSCVGCRRGFNQTYHFRKTRGTNDLSSVVKTFDSHIHDGGQYAELESGVARAQRSTREIQRDREKRQAEARQKGRFNPLRRR